MNDSVPLVGVIDGESPAALSGLRTGDMMISIDGQAVRNWRDVQRALGKFARRYRAAVLATGALSLIGFVPIVAVAVMPLQIAAWLVRGIVFQYLALTALGAYLAQYRHYLDGTRLAPQQDKRPA